MSIREIPAAAVTDAVEALCIEANTSLPVDVKAALDAAEAAEPWPLAKGDAGPFAAESLRCQRKRTCPSVRTPVWPVSLSSWGRMCILTVI